MKKEWKDVVGYEGLYQVSNYGEIKSSNIIKGKNSYIRSNKTSFLCKNGIKESITVNRIVAEHFIPNPENKKLVLYKDFNCENNRVTNLKWATYSEKMYYLISKGKINYKTGEENPLYGLKFLFNTSEKNHKCKLTDKQILAIRKSYSDGKTQVHLSKKYGISQFNISRIVNRQNRTNV